MMRPSLQMALLILVVSPLPPAAAAAPPSPAGAVQRGSYRVLERDARALVTRIEKSADRFRRSVDRSLDRSRLDGTRQEDAINDLVKDLENATDRLEDRVKDERQAGPAAREVLQRGAGINRLMQRGRFSATAERDWRSLRSDLDRLARLYRLSWTWDERDNRDGRGWERRPR